MSESITRYLSTAKYLLIRYAGLWVCISVLVAIVAGLYDCESLLWPYGDKVTTWADFYSFTFGFFIPLFICFVSLKKFTKQVIWSILSRMCIITIADQFSPKPYNWHLAALVGYLSVILWWSYVYHWAADKE